MNALLDSLQTENESLLDVTLTVTAYNYLKNENYKKAVRRAMLTENFKPSTLYGLQIEGFKTAAVSPAATLKNPRARNQQLVACGGVPVCEDLRPR